MSIPFDELDKLDEELEKEFDMDALFGDNADEQVDEDVEDIENADVQDPIEDSADENVDTTDEGEEDTASQESPVADEDVQTIDTPDIDENVNNADKPQSKEDYTFAKLRTDNKALQDKVDKYERSQQLLDKLARIEGYASVESFQDAIDKSLEKKEAEANGMTEAQYAELKTLKEKVANMEAEKKEAIQKANFLKFNTSKDRVFNEMGLSEKDDAELFERLSNAGYDLDTLLSLPDPSFLIKGIMADKLVSREQTKAMDKIKANSKIAEEKHTGAGADEFDLDKLINDELKVYAKENGYSF